MKIIDDLLLVSRMAAALETLPDAALREPLARFESYPQRPIAGLGDDDYARFDLDACKAEMIRRALRVGRGFSRVSEAA